MRWIIYIAGSGWFFFLGLACIALALLAFAKQGVRPARRRLGTILALLGAIFISISGTPLADWFYGLAGGASLLWLLAEQWTDPKGMGTRQRLRTCTALIWFSGIACELPYHFPPVITVPPQTPLSIIADSITAGIGEHEAVTWPNLIANEHGIDIHDFSRMGAGVASAYAQAERIPPGAGLILLEIGGNDLFGATSIADFELGLERLLTRVCTAEHTVLMFELPIPPFCNRFGQVQRRLAARHGVPLVPKRALMGVLTGADSTIDSIHLTQAGHDQMAQVVWKLIQSSYAGAKEH